MLYFVNDYSEGAHEKILQHLILSLIHISEPTRRS